MSVMTGNRRNTITRAHKKNVSFDSDNAPKRSKRLIDGNNSDIENGKKSRTYISDTYEDDSDDPFVLENEPETETDTEIDDTKTETATKTSKSASKKYKEGELVKMNEDEKELPIDLIGESKIDPNGILGNRREYAIPIFTLPDRDPVRLYIVCATLARQVGVSYTPSHFKEYPLIKRIFSTAKERDFLSDTGIYTGLRGKNRVAVMTARSAFMVFGHKVIKEGMEGRDDYYKKGTTLHLPIELESRFNEFVPNDEPIEEGQDVESFEFVAARLRTYNSKLYARRIDSIRSVEPNTNSLLVPLSTQFMNVNWQATNKRLRPYSRAVYMAPDNTQIQYVHEKNGPVDKLEHRDQGTDLVTKTKELYPIRLLEFQKTNLFPILQSLHSNRTYQEARECRANNVYKNMKLERSLLEESAHIIERSSELLGSQAMEMSKSTSVNQNSTMTDKVFYCGVRTQTRNKCRRTVANEGARCLYHKGMDNNDPDISSREMNRDGSGEENVCNDCGSTSAPEALLLEDHQVSVKELIICSKCEQSYHPLCLEITTKQAITKITEYEWKCNACKLCERCNSGELEHELLICEQCDRAWHMECCDPPILELPKGQWCCEMCTIE